MSLTSPPGQGKRLTQLLAYIVDDDDRTRRANLLLRTVSTCLLTGRGHSGHGDAVGGWLRPVYGRCRWRGRPPSEGPGLAATQRPLTCAA